MKNNLNITILLLVIFFSSFGNAQELVTNNRLIFGPYKERTASMGVGDIDNDGDLDVVVANGRHWPAQNRILFNNGKGKFTVAKPLGIESATSYATELADFDGDGDLDIAVGNDMAPNSLFINDGMGNFTKMGSFGKKYASTRNLVVADIDSDGDMDILITNRGMANEICLNNGAGEFIESLSFGTKDDATIDVEVADMNHDGALDLVLANRDKQQNFIYLNDGQLKFTQKIPYGTGDDNTRSVAVVDMNQNGYLDIIVANINEPNRIYFGDQALSFSNTILFDTSFHNSSAVSVADLNLDGAADIIIGNFKQPNVVFINQGDGRVWEKMPLKVEDSFTYDILAADLTGDGKPDIMESNSDELNRYYQNKFPTPILAGADEEGTFLIYRRQSLIGEETYGISRDSTSTIVRSLQGENERGRISGVLAEMHLGKNFTPQSYSSIRIARGDTTNIFQMQIKGDSVAIQEKHFDIITKEIPSIFFPLHSGIPAAIEIMLYQFYFKQLALSAIPTLPRGEVSITYKGEDIIQINNKEEKLARYVVEGINWGGRTVWLDKDKNLIALVKANTQIREVIRKGYEAAMPVFIAGHVKEQINALTEYTQKLKVDQPKIIALIGADLVDGVIDRTQKDQTLIIENGKIAAIGSRSETDIPKNAKIIDVRGKTLIPGLWDMHAHSNQVQWGPAYLSCGITTIRDNGNEVELATAFRDGIAKDGLLGPDILLAGMTDGPGKRGNGIIRATNEEEARKVVKMYYSKGYKQIKIYNSIEPEVLKVLAEEAHNRGMTVTGHIPVAVGTTEKAVALGMDMFSHDRAIYSILFPEKVKQELGKLLIEDASVAPERIQKAIQFLLDNQIGLDPTMGLRMLINLSSATPIESLEPDAEKIAYELWETKRFRKGINPERAKILNARNIKILEIIGKLYRAGIPIVAGTDNGVPAFGLYLEMELYHKYAGLSPFETIQTATIIPAKLMRLDGQTGTLEIGKEADIAILDKNPLENISNIRTVSAVLTNGNYYEGAPLRLAADFLPNHK